MRVAYKIQKRRYFIALSVPSSCQLTLYNSFFGKKLSDILTNDLYLVQSCNSGMLNVYDRSTAFKFRRLFGEKTFITRYKKNCNSLVFIFLKIGFEKEEYFPYKISLYHTLIPSCSGNRCMLNKCFGA